MREATALSNRTNMRSWSYAVTNKPLAVTKESNALCDESKIIMMYLNYVSSAKSNLSTQDELAVKFAELKTKWETDTARSSSATLIAMHPAYQKIIGMGSSVIPLILLELEKKPGHWFWALKAITEEDPVLPEQRGRMEEMREAWLHWGKEKRYI